MKKSNSIYFWKIIFTYIIVIFHFDNAYHIATRFGVEQFNNAFTGVDFFFIVSGFLLYKKARSPSAPKNAIAYTADRYKGLYVKYILSFVAVFAAICLEGKTALTPVELLWDSKWEILMVQSLALGRGWNLINPTAWYLSVMMVCGTLIYFLLDRYRDAFAKVMAPVAAVLLLAVIFVRMPNLDVAVNEPGNYLYYPLFRGFAEMSMGVWGAALQPTVVKRIPEVAASLAGNLVLLAACVVSWHFGHSHVDYLISALLLVGVTLAFTDTPENILTGPLVRRISGMTISVYLMHDLFRSHVIPYVIPPESHYRDRFLALGIYLLMVTAAAILLEILARPIEKTVFQKGK